jgi:hypothetical protein
MTESSERLRFNFRLSNVTDFESGMTGDLLEVVVMVSNRVLI